MSTAGSNPSAPASPGASAFSPPAGPPSADGPRRPRLKIFRWRGIFALLFGFGVVIGFWLLFGERIIRSTMVEAGSKALGTEVDIAGFKLNLARTVAEVRGIAVADPFDHMRNLFEADLVRIEIEPEPLLEKKLVLRRLTVAGVRGGTQRKVAARPTATAGFAPRALLAMENWKKQFKVPLLSLTPIDTIKSLVLDPTQLRTVQAAIAVSKRADSLRTDLVGRVERMRLRETLDSARALAARLQGQTPRSLGVAGTRTALADGRRLTARVDSLRRAVDDLQRTTRTAIDSVSAAVRGLDDTRRADFEFARGLLQLPRFDAPSIGPALFGKVSIDAFQQGIYWVNLARAYAPPGLLPKEQPGPSRRRRAGTTVHFVKPASYPLFLLRQGDLDLSIGGRSAAAGKYTLKLQNVTTDPALVRRPMQFALQRTASGSAVEAFAASGSIDHAGPRPREVIDVRGDGIALPSFSLPSLPIKAQLGRGRSSWHLDMDGDKVSGLLTLATDKVTWPDDSQRLRALNTIESLVARVIRRVGQLDVTAEMSGTLAAPTINVRSNLDRAVGDGIKSVAGEEIVKAEARVQAQVDALADQYVTPLKTRAAELRAEVDQRLRDAPAQLDAVKAQITAELKTLGTGLIPGLP